MITKLVFLGCVAEMRNLGKSNQICDGVVDCPDFSDELYCPYCPEHNFHCGVGKMCVPKEKNGNYVQDSTDSKVHQRNLDNQQLHHKFDFFYPNFSSHEKVKDSSRNTDDHQIGQEF